MKDALLVLFNYKFDHQNIIMKESRYKLTTGEPMLLEWLHYASGYRREPKIIEKSRKNHSCALGCEIVKGEKYLSFDVIDGEGSHLSIGLCNEHFPKMLKDLGIENDNMISKVKISELYSFLISDI